MQEQNHFNTGIYQEPAADAVAHPASGSPRKNRRRTSIPMMLLGFFMFVVAIASVSYAWLAITRTPVVSDLNINVITDSRLEIALDEDGEPGTWSSALDLSEVLEDLVPLRPVTYSKVSDCMYTSLYDVDGRSTGTFVGLSDEKNANVQGNADPAAVAAGYYIAVPFWVRADQDAVISLAEAMEIEEGRKGSGTFVVGNPIWNGETLTHENGAGGLETAIRIGFRCQDTDLDGKAIGNSRFIIYEPNCDTHISTKDVVYVDTTSPDKGLLVEEENLIRQTTSTWDETTPVLQNDVVYSLGDFMDDTALFNISRNTMEKVTMYLWIEGRDVDCNSRVMYGQTAILACIQLTPSRMEDTGITRD